MTITLDEFIQTTTNFITDIEEIVDIMSEANQVYLYDTSAISSHELGFFQHHDLSFLRYTEGSPLILTETILKETRILEDTENRYSTYFSKFKTVLYIKESDLLELLKVDFETTEAKQKYLIASEKAFSSIQLLKEAVKSTRKQFTQKIDVILYAAYDAFFSAAHQTNRGEISLVWLSTIIEHLPGNTRVVFMGIDSDLKDFVERCYMSSHRHSHFAKEITLCSNETLLQSLYKMNRNQQELQRLITIYRNPQRKTYYYKKIKKVLTLIPQAEKMSNALFLNAVIQEDIEIIY